MHLFLTCFGGPLDRVLLTFCRMHTHQAQRLPDRNECTTTLRCCVEHVFGSWRQRALLPQMFATWLNLVHIAWSRNAKEELDRLSFLFDSLELAAFAEAADATCAEWHATTSTLSVLDVDVHQEKVPGRADSQHAVVTRRRRGGSNFLVASVVFSGSPAKDVSKLQAGSCVYCVGHRKAPMPHVSVLGASSSCFVPVFWSRASESSIP